MTDRMVAILRLLYEEETRYGKGMTGNAIGSALGFDGAWGGRGQRGRGRGSRRFGPAQRVIFSLNRLRDLGLVATGPRTDGLSGGAYYITEAGEEAIR